MFSEQGQGKNKQIFVVKKLVNFYIIASYHIFIYSISLKITGHYVKIHSQEEIG